MAIESEPSYELNETPAREQVWITEKAQLLMRSTPDELIDYSMKHFGPSERHVPIKACEMQIDLNHLLERTEYEDAFLAVLPVLWALYDETKAR